MFSGRMSFEKPPYVPLELWRICQCDQHLRLNVFPFRMRGHYRIETTFGKSEKLLLANYHQLALLKHAIIAILFYLLQIVYFVRNLRCLDYYFIFHVLLMKYLLLFRNLFCSESLFGNTEFHCTQFPL